MICKCQEIITCRNKVSDKNNHFPEVTKMVDDTFIFPYQNKGI